MSEPGELRTERLILRRWRESDLAPFAEMNADPAVMEHFPAPLMRDESDALARRIADGFACDGFGLWAVEVIDRDPFIGFVGLLRLDYDARFTPAVEVGWRLKAASWGNGYATEGAREALRFAFGEAGLSEVVSTTAVANARSRAVMERLGMSHDAADDFDHPKVDDPRLKRHVLYRLAAPPNRRGRSGV